MNTAPHISTGLTGLLLLLLTGSPAHAQASAHDVLYEIQSGTYVEEGGFAGELSYPLPNDSQTFVLLHSDPGARTVQLTFLDHNFQPGFFPLLTNGVSTERGLQFRYRTEFPLFVPNLVTINYLVVTNTDTLQLDGAATISYAPCHCICADCWTGLAHREVQATRLPVVSIHLGEEVELCWSTAPDRTYQPLFSTDLSADWIPLGSPVRGTGSIVCVHDQRTLQEPQRFYRIAIMPGPR
ncbi:MAG TPA: hypothetical protein VNU68_15455 [Verrucomicrobiae bacterium]|nr:hypothetical protein [Verrucomicrobiae bacterium]